MEVMSWIQANSLSLKNIGHSLLDWELFSADNMQEVKMNFEIAYVKQCQKCTTVKNQSFSVQPKNEWYVSLNDDDFSILIL